MTTPDASEAWVDPIFNAVESHALASGHFDKVNRHEPKSAPRTGVTCAIWVQAIRATRVSGLNSVSAVLTFHIRVYTSMTQEPLDAIDPNVLKAVSSLLRSVHDNFDFGLDGLVRNVDLLGSEGEPVSARAGYLDIDGKMHRVMTITLPIICNDIWPIGS